VWAEQGALAALKQGIPGRDSERALEGVLTHSLSGMDAIAVSMFLDVATILRGQPNQLVMAVWTAWHGASAVTLYEDLVWRSLLGSDAQGRLMMHDVLVALGRGVVLHRKAGLEQHFGSRLWMQDGDQVVGFEQVWPCLLSRKSCPLPLLVFIVVGRCMRRGYKARGWSQTVPHTPLKPVQGQL
jgi:hypothetical protein